MVAKILEKTPKITLAGFVLLGAFILSGCQLTPNEFSPTTSLEDQKEGAKLVVYAGRSESLVGNLIDRFRVQTSLEVEVRYGDTAEMAAMILEEGNNSPADVYYAQDAGALGALAEEGRALTLPEDIVQMVEERFRSAEQQWVGITGRARVVAYNTQSVEKEELPSGLFGFCDPVWQGRLGWAPTNGSFQAFVTTLRLVEGEQKAEDWLTCIQANNPISYVKNSAILEAIGSQEIDAGFVNHYYLYNFLKDRGEDFPVKNHYLADGDSGSMVNISGVLIVNTTDNRQVAQEFVRFLLSEEAQQYFVEETKEYPLIKGIAVDQQLKPLEEINTPVIDLSNLKDLRGTLSLLDSLNIL